MATYDYLRKQALKDVWRMPGIDRQFIITPQRITKKYGRKKHIDVAWETYRLPDATSTWHVYDASALSPIVLNLFRRCEGWTPLSDSTNKRGVYINAYVDSGVELPRFDSYYRYTNSGALLIAFKVNKKFIPDLEKDTVSFRVYSGAAINIGQMPPISNQIGTYGAYINVPADLATLEDQLELVPAGAHINLYHNGIWYAELQDMSIKPGDWVEFIYDTSVYKTYEFAVKDLFHYNSTMDSDQKYLLHPPGSSDVLDFYDDIDIYVYQKVAGVPLRGIYFHKNEVSAVRQLTHRDYGIRTRNFAPISRVLNALTEPNIPAPVDSLYIQLVIRDGNIQNSKLTYEHTRLFELYKLNNTDIVRAMQGIDANVPFWAAPELEKSFYAYGLRCSYNELTKEVAESIYGYNASAKIVGDTPVKLTSPNPQDVPIPIRMQHGCTMYEYDSEGLMIGWYQHLGGPTYRPRNDETVYLEGIVGLGADRIDQLQNIRQTQLNEVFTYRIYNGSLIGNVVQPTFEDVTGSDKYKVENGLFTWLSTRAADYPIVMSDSKFYAKDYDIRPHFGTMIITLQSQQTRPTGDGFYNLPFPLGQIDVFLNGYSLLKDLDYFVDFPRVHIVNKDYLKNAMTEDQKVHIRFVGFPTKTFEFTNDGDVGFIEHGFLSNNNRYDLRDDKVQRVVIGGKLYTKSELEFSEEHQGVSITDPANGLPYMVKDMLVPVKPYTVVDMYELRKKSQEVDKIVSDYLTLKLPQPPRGELMAITRKYEVFSPFTNQLITDLRSGAISLPLRLSGFDRQEVVTICKPYEYLLQIDPLKSPHLQDERFVAVHPHGYPQAVGVSANAYRFMTKVVEIYCDGKMTLSPFLKTA